jgi:hypothetical protein
MPRGPKGEKRPADVIVVNIVLDFFPIFSYIPITPLNEGRFMRRLEVERIGVRLGPEMRPPG